MTSLALATLLGLSLCAAPKPAKLAPLPSQGDDFSESFSPGTPEEVGVDPHRLIALTRHLRDTPLPVYSLLISRKGKLVYELYTSSLGRDEAHYVMSVTKSVVSALVGIAVDEKLVRGPDASVTDLLPRSFFQSDSDLERFRAITLTEVMGMSVLDAPVPPHKKTREARARLAGFWACKDRVAFALSQPLLPEPGKDFQYTDLTPMIAVGVVQKAARMSALEYAQARLFGPMRFKNVEWMHQDPTGFDNGGFGLRLRPVDMQKLGVLFLKGGEWEGKSLVSRAWVERSFTPWIRSRAALPAPNYGWYWWARSWAPGFSAHLASGWKGQRIAVIPEQELVVTMTAVIEDGTEDEAFTSLMREFVVPAVSAKPLAPDAAARAELAALLDEVRSAPTRIKKGTEERMIPTVAPKGTHRKYDNGK